MAQAIIQIKFHSGVSIEDAFSEAIRLVALLNVRVEFMHYSIECVATKDSVLENGVVAYKAELQRSLRHSRVVVA